MNLDNIDKRIQKLQIQRQLELEKSLSSTSPDAIMKAKKYLEDKNKSNNSSKGFVYSPEAEFHNGMGYKTSYKPVTYNLLRNMSYTPVVQSIIVTRLNQISNFLQFTIDTQKEGWTVRKKLGRFDIDKNKKVSDQEKSKIDYIASFLENGGLGQKWQTPDDFDDFIRKQIIDTLTFDQTAFELERSRNNKLFSFQSLDASTIRLLETNPDESDNMPLVHEYEEVNGVKPTYCQVYNSNIITRQTELGKEQIIWYPWELSFGIRNKSTDMRLNGYGKSELEILVDVVSYQLFGMHYNGNFFKQGSNPKGFFTIEGNVDQGVLNEFRQAWRNTVSGWQNSHKVPVFEGNKINWVDMQQSNKDMEWQNWTDFLILMTCTVYSIDPSELGYSFQKQANIFGQDGQKERLDHSKEKGLKPLLAFLQKRINKYIVQEIDSAYEFIWTGINLEDESTILDGDVKKVQNGFVSMEDMFMKYSNRKFNPDKDTILNSTFQQAQQMKQYGGQDSNAAVDEMDGGDSGEGAQNPFDSFDDNDTQKSISPFEKSLQEYINKVGR